MSSYFDRRRDPVPAPDMAVVDNRSGRHDEPRAAVVYPARPTSGHKLPAARHRVQVQIGAASSERLDERTQRMLDEAVEGLSDRDHHEVLRAKAIGTAVGAHLRVTDPFAGYLSTGEDEFIRLLGPQAVLRHVFGVSS
jgi:hypothetical protein